PRPHDAPPERVRRGCKAPLPRLTIDCHHDAAAVEWHCLHLLPVMTDVLRVTNPPPVVDELLGCGRLGPRRRTEDQDQSQRETSRDRPPEGYARVSRVRTRGAGISAFVPMRPSLAPRLIPGLKHDGTPRGPRSPALDGDQGEWRPTENRHVEEKRLVLDVVEVVLELLTLLLERPSVR